MRQANSRPEVKTPPRWHFHEPERMWLDNGLQVLVSQRPGQHIASVALLLDIPLTVEPLDREGVAAITQHCLDEGTAGHPGTAFADRLEDLGAILSGATGHSAAEFYLDVPAERLAQALPLLAEAVREPELREADVSRLRQLRLAEIDHTMANSAQRAVLGFRAAAIAGRYRCSRMAGGRADSVEAVTTADVRAFHATYYRPEGATLVITGELPRDVFALANASFGDWLVPGSVAFQHESPMPRRPRCWIIDRPGAVQADVRLGCFGIDRSDPRWADLQVATHALGGAFLSRLNRVLREEKGYTYGVHLVNQPLRDGGLIAVQGSFRTEVVPAALDLARQLLDVTSAPITRAEVTDAVTYTTGVSPLRYSTASGVTERIASLIAAGVSVDFINANAYAISQVTPESATASLADVLPPDALTLVVVGDAATLTDPLLRDGWAVVPHS